MLPLSICSICFDPVFIVRYPILRPGSVLMVKEDERFSALKRASAGGMPGRRRYLSEFGDALHDGPAYMSIEIFL